MALPALTLPSLSALALAELAEKAGGSRALGERILAANTAAEAFAHAAEEGVALGDEVARAAWETAAAVVAGVPIEVEIAVFHRAGKLGGLAAWLGFTLPSAVALTALALWARNLDLTGAGWVHGLELAAAARLDSSK